MQIEQQRILLTGASGGIGQALAHELTARGARLGLVGRSPEPLARLAAALSGGPGEALAIPADLRLGTGRESARRAMHQAFGGIDVLINNAGTTDFGNFADQDFDRLRLDERRGEGVEWRWIRSLEDTPGHPRQDSIAEHHRPRGLVLLARRARVPARDRAQALRDLRAHVFDFHPRRRGGGGRFAAPAVDPGRQIAVASHPGRAVRTPRAA